MRWVPILAVLLAGCVWTPSEDARSRQDDPCWGNGYSADGVHAGAWDNATREGSGFGAPSMQPGVPVGPGTARFLGSDANITAVRWRVDGNHRSEYVVDGKHPSEYVEVRFGYVPTLGGELHPVRSFESAEAVVRTFLDQVRGVREDNAALAADLAPGLFMPRGGDGDGTPGAESAPAAPPKRSVPLPDGPWTLSSHLAAHLDASTLQARARSLAVVDGPWRWELDVPGASNTTYLDGASWYVQVDARDRVHVRHGSVQGLNETALVARLEGFLPQRGVVGADVSAWTLDLGGWPSSLCPPDLP